MRQMLAILVLACLTPTDLKNNVCWALCRHEGFDTGYYHGDDCICGVAHKFDEFTDVVLKVVPPKEEPRPYYQSYYGR